MENNLKLLTLCVTVLIYSHLVSTVHAGAAAPYTEEAEKKVEDALTRIGKPKTQESASPAERMKASLETLRSSYTAAGYDYDATIVQIADDMQNHPERFPKNRYTITTVNHVVAGIHIMMSECEYQKVDCLKFFSVDTVQAIRFLMKNTEFKI